MMIVHGIKSEGTGSRKMEEVRLGIHVTKNVVKIRIGEKKEDRINIEAIHPHQEVRVGNHTGNGIEAQALVENSTTKMASDI